MPLTNGTHLGPYEIVAPLGAGGMGEVYRARDTKLNREVALKVLPEVFAADPERITRFQREAQLLASLSHPNIAGIYGLEESNGIRALVLELIEGPTLQDRLGKGPIPLDQALPIAKQIAEALENAHEKGVIHRDLKPANIKLTPDETVKVLDFGIAKMLEVGGAGEAGGAGPVGLTYAPTITTPAMTLAGVILGTAAYMSPEQAKGKPVDRRADIWAFGVVLWEMLTGRRMYDGETAPETLARVIEREPDFNALPASTPASIRSLLLRCLTKDPRNRLQAIGEARIAIDRAMAQPASSAPESHVAAGHDVRSSRTGALSWTVAGVLGLASAAVLLTWAPWRSKVPSPPVRVNADIGTDASLAIDIGTAAVLSPDGQLLAFAAQKGPRETSQLYIRRLDQLQATSLAGTDDARGPFFSPDGQWIAFFAGGKLKKVATTGGTAVTLCDAPNSRGGSWSEDGTIVFQPDIGSTSASLARVSSSGGTPELVIREENGRPRFPQVLPGGKALLYTRYAPGGAAELILLPLPTGERRVVLRGGYGRYLSSGHLVYVQDATLFAVAFDLNRLEMIGQPAPVLEGVTASQNMAGAQFAVSEDGTLVYLPGQSTNTDPPIEWMDRSGKSTPLLAKPTNWSNPRFSPDGRRLAVDIIDGKMDVWIYEWGRDTLSRLTFDPGGNGKPVWTPDGGRIVFRSNRPSGSAFNLYWQRSDGAGDAQRLTESSHNQQPGSWHPSGKYLAFSEESVETNPDLWILPIDGNESSGWRIDKPTVFLKTPFIEQEPMFSPDGRWLAYFSNESGPYEVYVRPFPGPGGKWQISTGGGVYPTWSRARAELFFFTLDQQIMVASYKVDGQSFRADQPRPWSDARFLLRPRYRSFDLHPDGNRFALSAVPQTQVSVKRDKVVFVFNFFDELRRLAPARKPSN
jgi:serine/threonine protein kinase/Tol biopolymer transport system component